MDLNEYNKVKNLTYLDYCDYLQNKYGIGLSDYMTKSFNKNSRCTRTKEGLLAHHKMEDRMIMLSTKEIARLCPFEWQEKKNIVYCDYLEHLLLHVLICIYPSCEKVDLANVGIGGVINFIVPELNDYYSGWQTNQQWRKVCHDKIKGDKEVYIQILCKFLSFERNNPNFNYKMLYSSFNENYGIWDKKKNKLLFDEIIKRYKNAKEVI